MARIDDTALLWVSTINSDPDVRDMAMELLDARAILRVVAMNGHGAPNSSREGLLARKFLRQYGTPTNNA